MVLVAEAMWYWFGGYVMLVSDAMWAGCGGYVDWGQRLCVGLTENKANSARKLCFSFCWD